MTLNDNISLFSVYLHYFQVHSIGKIKVNKSQTRCHSFMNHSGKIKARTKLCRQSCTYPLLLLSICMYENFTEQIVFSLSHTHTLLFLLPSVLFLSYLQFLLLLYFPTTFSHNVVLSLIILILINTTGLQCIYFVVWTDRVCSV